MFLSTLAVLITAFLSSVIGSICGIGGGVIIKPVIDLFSIMPVASGSFASGMTVLSMACFSCITICAKKENIEIEWKSSIPIALGAIIGGIVGKELFSVLYKAYAPSSLAALQSFFLMIMTLCTIIYTINKRKIISRHVDNGAACTAIGLALGAVSSFLGIGGGPMNLAVLYYFFSMSNKKAAQNSLLIICFSQFASFIRTISTGSVPEVNLYTILLMMLSGITGAYTGRRINSRINDEAVGKCFIMLLFMITIICLYNVAKYTFL